MPRKPRQKTSLVTVALKVPDHRAELLETRIADLLAITAVETGTDNNFDRGALCYMIAMARQLGRSGYLPEGLDQPGLETLCRRALLFDDVEALHEVSDIHEAQTGAASATEYLRARMSL